ncbi:hypothetical protein, partial [Oscillibacter sp. CAG:155]|uniref:hypothetical protein n=1 Tax=Oscillibacter sp. CAG:155 TaxID=1262910 RepID=UPI00263F86B6
PTPAELPRRTPKIGSSFMKTFLHFFFQKIVFPAGHPNRHFPSPYIAKNVPFFDVIRSLTRCKQNLYKSNFSPKMPFAVLHRAVSLRIATLLRKSIAHFETV